MTKTKSHKLPQTLTVVGLTVAVLALVALVGGGMAGWFTVAVPAQAQANTVKIEPAGATVPPAGSVDVAVVADAPALGLGSWDLDVTYDQAAVSVSTCVPHFAGVCAFSTPGTVDIIGFVGTPLTGEQTMATITFDVVGTEGQSSAVAITVVDFYDGIGDPLTPATTDGTVTIQTPTATPAAAEPPASLPSAGTSGPAQHQAAWPLIGALAAAGPLLAGVGLATRRRLGK